ncbi:hypothetical protein QTO34_014286 [Cnephaeus nilssonii]|uniref:Reverse transcriptase domain-containing protein n=1 Tax=Cnephaeus nilssonii TaxID=3371016 RepID=A0AA40I620_CNENI|nr:hypothetical protein QTO34_014286 [Eptesicus nilssonii]
MGRDLLAKMGTEITFAPDGSAQLSLEGNPPGLAKDHAPVLIQLKPGAQPVKIRQYPIPREAHLGIQNTPLLPVKKSGTNDYRPVQDLGAVITLHSALPNPYTLLGLIPSEAGWFTCLDLKDAFFCLRLVPSSQSLFALKWENPTTGAKEQFTWTRLPQGQDLGCVLLQYVDDLLLASSTRAQCWEGTPALLRLLTETGYRVSKKKAQICQKEVKYLGFRITQEK